MTGIDVCIYAEGNLPEEEARELSDLGMRSHVDHVVLDGTVVDQAALMGVLERLRRAGMAIREVGPAGPRPECGRHARLAVVGHVGDLLREVLETAVVTEEPPTTTAVIDLTSDDDVFELLQRIEALGIAIRALRIGRPMEGFAPEEHSHFG
ncbi:MAG: hypothetical protein WCA30_12890 [Dermatophilaceae bacterium]